MINVFPNPVYAKEKSGEFVIKEKIYFIIDSSFSNKEFERLSVELWSNFTNKKSKLEIIKKEGIKSAVISECADEIVEDLSTNYEYEVDVQSEKITISYNEEVGLIHAFSTILQLISSCRVKCVKIKDKPSLAFRGMHFCVFSETSLLFLKKMIRLTGLMKCSHIILEFWGTLKLDCFKYFGWDFAYSKEDIKPLIADGMALGMEFIPMFNHFGHATMSRSKTGKHVVLDQAIEYEDYYSPDGWTWNVKNDDVLSLQQKMREEFCNLFGKGEYFHIGCDEVFMDDYRIDPYDKEDNKTFVDFINKSAKAVLDMGRKPIIWGDMLLCEEDFPYPYCRNSSRRCYDRSNIDKLLKEIIIDDWQYNVEEEKDDTVKYFLSKKEAKNIILSPWDGNVWKGNLTLKGRCALAKKHNLLGVLGTTWNSVYKDISSMLYTTCLMWEEDENEIDKLAFGALKSYAAKNIRKLVPPNGDYYKAGYFNNGEMLNL